MKEYELTVDVVIELPDDVDPDAFMEQLWDVIIENVEAHGAHMGGGFQFKEYVEEEGDG